jgi:hypothetical protein
MSRQAYWRLAAGICFAAISLRATGQENGFNPPSSAYDAAREAARAGDVDRAEDHLRAAVRDGFADFSAMRREPDLAPLRDRPVMTAILAARDAADPVLADRRLGEWRERLGASRYEFARDDSLRVEVLLPRSWGITPAEVLESVDSLMDALAPSLFPGRWRQRVLIILLEESDASIFLPHANARGKYLHSQRLILATDIGRSLRHELVHALHHAHMDSLGQEHPVWVQEGLASLFESALVSSDGSIAFETNERDTIMRLMLDRGRTLPVEKYIALDAEAFDRDEASNYAMARSLLMFLHNRGALDDWYGELCGGLLDDPTGGAAFAAALSLPLHEIDSQWRDSVSAAPAIFTSETIIVAKGDQTSNSAPPADNLSPISDRLAAKALYERIRPRRIHEYLPAIPHLESVIALDPDFAAAHYDLGLACVLEGALDRAEAERVILERLDRNLASLLESAMNTVKPSAEGRG